MMTVEIGNIYPGLCCADYDFEVALIFPDSIWGTCQNPACEGRDGRGTDHFQGVSNWSQEDFEELVAKAGGQGDDDDVDYELEFSHWIDWDVAPPSQPAS